MYIYTAVVLPLNAVMQDRLFIIAKIINNNFLNLKKNKVSSINNGVVNLHYLQINITEDRLKKLISKNKFDLFLNWKKTFSKPLIGEAFSAHGYHYNENMEMSKMFVRYADMKGYLYNFCILNQNYPIILIHILIHIPHIHICTLYVHTIKLSLLPFNLIMALLVKQWGASISQTLEMGKTKDSYERAYTDFINKLETHTAKNIHVDVIKYLKRKKMKFHEYKDIICI